MQNIQQDIPENQAVGFKGQNWRTRTKNHKENIAALLIERALDGMGVRSIEDLYSHPELYGVSPRNRISELGKTGWEIGRKPCGNGTFYWLRRDGEGRTYPQTRRFDEPLHPPRPLLVKQPEPKSETPWSERLAGETRHSRAEQFSREFGVRHPWKTAFSEKRLADPDCFTLKPPEPKP